MSDLTVKTNNVPRPVIYGFELTPNEVAEFDYLSGEELECSTFVRYKGYTYYTGDFMRNSGLPDCSPLRAWDGHHCDSFFSGVLIKYCEDHEYVVMATYFS